MSAEVIGMILSLCGMTAQVLSYQMKNKKVLLLVQVMGYSFFALSYFFSDAEIGGIITILSLTRSIIFLLLKERRDKWLYIVIGGLWISYAIAPVIYNIFIVPNDPLTDKLWNSVPAIGAIVGTVALSQRKLNAVRLITIGESACWLGFNLYVGLGALGGILCEIFVLCSIAISLVRFREGERKEENRQL